MFNYYGSKSKIAHHYPQPVYNTIIEPFAGAAWYSLLYYKKNIILNEKYEIIYKIWDYIINKSNPSEILQKTKFRIKEDLRKTKFNSEEIRNFIGFCASHGSSSPCNIIQKWSQNKKKGYSTQIENKLIQIIKMSRKIKHWKVILGDYKELPNIEATWFIDPPYQYGGQRYFISDINYQELSKYCKERRGQVIVCENTKSNWLEFEPLVKIAGARKKSTECIWTNYKRKNIYDFLNS